MQLVTNRDQSIGTACSAALVALMLVSCRAQQEVPLSPRSVQTIENSPAKIRPVEVPPTIDENAAPTPKAVTDTTGAAVPAGDSRDEALARKMELPFAPAIAMDPVDGSKVSINTTTPTVDYKHKLYYFISEDNRKEFLANPDQYLKGTFVRY
jgi:YHS domain-containing protein